VPRPAVARIWEGRTRASVAKDYAAYDGVAEFMTISYWGSRDEIRAYAGDDIEKTHHLPRDAEYLLELPPYVKHYDILFGD
jgi:hypothetical protein